MWQTKKIAFPFLQIFHFRRIPPTPFTDTLIACMTRSISIKFLKEKWLQNVLGAELTYNSNSFFVRIFRPIQQPFTLQFEDISHVRYFDVVEFICCTAIEKLPKT